MTPRFVRFAAVALFLMCGSLASQAAWLAGGTLAATVTTSQIDPFLQPDGLGGAYVSCAAGPNDLLQRVTAGGEPAEGWSAAGLHVPPGADPYGIGPSRIARAGEAADGLGNIYVGSAQSAPCSAHCGGQVAGVIVMHRLSSTGALWPGWSASGLRPFVNVIDLRAYQRVSMAADRSGALVSVVEISPWYPSDPTRQLRVQSLTPEGVRRWGPFGITVSSDPGVGSQCCVLVDGQGGAFVYWSAFDSARAAVRIWGQHVSSRGRRLWGPQGKPLALTGAAQVLGPVAVSDGEGGTFVAWKASSTSGVDLVLDRVDAAGSRTWPAPLTLTRHADNGMPVAVVSSGYAACVLAWAESGIARPAGVYAQSVSARGRWLWAEGGVPASTSTSRPVGIQVATDGEGGAYLAWMDYQRLGGGFFSTHLAVDGRTAAGWDPAGSALWTKQSAADPNASLDSGPALVSTGMGEAIAAWSVYQHPMDSPLSNAYVEQVLLAKLTPTGVAGPIRDATASTSALGASRPAPAFALHAVRPNPTSAASTVRFALTDDSPARLELFDVAGRRVWSRDVGAFGAGEHEIALDASRQEVRPGVYLLRLEQATHVATTRVTVGQ